MIETLLTLREYLDCIDCGVTRMGASLGLKDISHVPRGYEEQLRIHVLGACGEMAVCKVFGVPFVPSVNTFHREADIGDTIEVRLRTQDWHDMPVRPDDVHTRWFVLVIGNIVDHWPTPMRVIGGICGKDAKRPEWYQNPTGHRWAWFVPQHVLLPATTDWHIG